MKACYGRRVGVSEEITMKVIHYADCVTARLTL
jgi:hypothetical protein